MTDHRTAAEDWLTSARSGDQTAALVAIAHALLALGNDNRGIHLDHGNGRTAHVAGAGAARQVAKQGQDRQDAPRAAERQPRNSRQ